MTDPIDYTNLSDDEIMNMERPAPVKKPIEEEASVDDPAGTVQSGEVVVDTTTDDPNPEDVKNDERGSENGEDDENGEGEPEGGNTPDADGGDAVPAKRNPLDEPDDDTGTPEDGKAAPKEKSDVNSEGEPKAGTEGSDDKTSEKAKDKDAPKKDDPAPDAVKTEEEGIDYKAAYDQIMAPFKANGKEVKLASPDEVIQLMQMGANYTKKLQALQPNLRVVKMLENNGLLDESKLSFLIDINKRDPEAIKKLLKDSNIDPMDIDTSVDPNYKPGNYKVSDQQMSFDNIVEELASTDKGQEILVTVSKNWDNESKDAIYRDPQILSTLAEQKQSGIYDQISEEVDRQKLLGHLNGVPYLQAYYQVGQAMQNVGAFNKPAPAPAEETTIDPVVPPTPEKTSKVIETRTAPSKTSTPNGDKAKAASPVKTAPKSTDGKQDFNPLSMSDDEIEKMTSLSKRL